MSATPRRSLPSRIASFVRDNFYPEGLARDLFTTPSFSGSSWNYEEYWRRRGPHDVMARHPIFAACMRPGSTVLDVGCGDGTFLEYVRRTRQVTGKGVDVSETALEIARKRDVEVEQADVTAPDFHVDDVFDHIVISEVLEHLPRPEDVLVKLRNNFRESLLVSVPNTAFYRYRLRLLLGRFPVQWVQHPSEHLRFWSVHDFERWAEELGFEVTDVVSSNGPLVLKDVWKNLFGNQMVYVLKRKGEV